MYIGGIMEEKKIGKQFNIFKLISYLSIGSLIAMLGLFVLIIMDFIPFNRFMFVLIGVLTVVSLTMSLATPWAKRNSEGKNKVLSYVMLGLIGLAMILWIIVVFLLLGIYNKIVANSVTTKNIAVAVNFIQACIIITLQVVFASVIALKISNFGKENMVLQVLTYLGYVIIDFFACYLVTRITFNNDGIKFHSLTLLTNKASITILIFAVIIVGVVEGFNKGRIKRMQKDQAEQGLAGELKGKKQTKINQTESQSNKAEDAEAKLEKLKALLDKNLITQEEYDKKKQEIIKDL